MIDYCFWCGRKFNDEHQGFEVYDKSFCCEKCLHEYEKTDNGIADKRSLYYYCDQCGKAIPKDGGTWWHRQVVTNNLQIQRRFCTSECCTQFYNEHPDEYNRAQRIEEDNLRKKQQEEQRKQQEEQKRREYEEEHREEWKKVEEKAKKINRFRLIHKTIKDGLFLIVYPVLFVLFIVGILPEKLFPLVLFSSALVYFIYSFFSVGHYIKVENGKMWYGTLLSGKKALDDPDDFLPVFIIMPIINFLWLTINSVIYGGFTIGRFIIYLISCFIIIPYNIIGGWGWKFLSSVNPLPLGILNVFFFYFYVNWGLSKNDFFDADKDRMVFNIVSFLLCLYHLILSVNYFLH